MRPEKKKREHRREEILIKCFFFFFEGKGGEDKKKKNNFNINIARWMDEWIETRPKQNPKNLIFRRQKAMRNNQYLKL